MSDEKKLKEYAEHRLSAYATGEDSLARLKRVQSAQKEEAAREKAPLRSWVKRFALTFSVVVVVVVVVLMLKLIPGGSGDFAGDGQILGGGNYAAESNLADKEKGVLLYADEALNEETRYLDLTLPQGVSLKKITVKERGESKDEIPQNSDEKQGYCYRCSLEDEADACVGTLDLIVAFDGYAPESFSFTADREMTLAGQTFSYSITQEGLFGKMSTDCECVYLSFDGATNEAACLELLRSIFSEK